MTTHRTAGPTYKIFERPGRETWIVDEGGYTVAKVNTMREAQRIVRACNAHAGMVEALKFTLELLSELTTDEFQKGGDKPARDKIQAALALAEEPVSP